MTYSRLEIKCVRGNYSISLMTLDLRTWSDLKRILTLFLEHSEVLQVKEAPLHS